MSEERRLDEKFKHGLVERKIRFNQMKSVFSLQSLAVRCIVRNLDYFCSKEDPFSCLPGTILTLVKKSLGRNRKNICRPEVLFRLITTQSRDLTVKLCDQCCDSRPVPSWTKEDVDYVFQLISHKCEHKLTELKLELCMQTEEWFAWMAPQPSIDQLHEVIRHQANLIRLDLASCGINDKTLAVIGSTCEHLIALSLQTNKSVTDNGILQLCEESRTHGHKLKIKELNLEGTSVGQLGIYTALSQLPDLEDLRISEEIILLEALTQFLHADQRKNLKLTRLTFNKKNSNSVNVNIKNIAEILPNVNNVRFQTDDLTPLYSLTNINTLNLCTWQPHTQLDILLPHLASNLTELIIKEHRCTLDLSMIGHFCPNIKKIDICLYAKTSAYQFSPQGFQMLEDIFVGALDAELFVIPSSYLLQILASKLLRKFDVGHIPEEILLELISKARDENTGIFSNLKQIILFQHNYSVETWLQLFCVAPNLKTVLFFISEEDDAFLKVINFIKRNKLNIYFS